MKITYYYYNSFIIESETKKIAIDPGALFFYYLRFSTVIPKSQWPSLTHIFVTHGDPDHYWHMDRVANVSKAPVICNKTMLKEIDGQQLILGPRAKGLAFTTAIENLRTLDIGETIVVDGMNITGVKTTHGPLTLGFGPFSKTFVPGPTERIGWGAIGFDIEVDGKRIVNLGDSLLEEKAWEKIKNPDVLMIPIGGKVFHNTMDELEALKAVEIMQPKLVIPCHYNSPAFFTKKYNPANDTMFKEEIEKMGLKCVLLQYNESTEI